VLDLGVFAQLEAFSIGDHILDVLHRQLEYLRAKLHRNYLNKVAFLEHGHFCFQQVSVALKQNLWHLSSFEFHLLGGVEVLKGVCEKDFGVNLVFTDLTLDRFVKSIFVLLVIV